jgi:nitroimidazol reductase NimA-like FMN-containing flavoprotein (pyridoxamine 5'-phosphate oxidase superfamily)
MAAHSAGMQEIQGGKRMEEHPHGAMRRVDREITDRAEIDTILTSTNVMRLALADGNVPFVVPVFYAYDGASICFHSADAGTKIEILKRNPKVCFEVSIDQGVIEASQACDFEARHRTVIGFGKANFIEEEAEKVQILDRIVDRFTSKRFEYPKANLRNTAVIRIEIESIKGKKHGF